MTLRIKLLGLPRMDVDGEHRELAGKKPWALLTYLALAPRAPSRRELAELLFPEAGDPLAAERWALLQVRRALGADASIVERDGRLALGSAEAEIDARALTSKSRGQGDRYRPRRRHTVPSLTAPSRDQRGLGTSA